jgi:hypothetical protein
VAKILAPDDATVVVPADQKSKPAGGRLSYTLRTPTLYDRVKLDRAIAAAGGVTHGVLEMIRALLRGVDVVMAESDADDRARTRALVQAHEADWIAYYENLRDGAFEDGAFDGEAGDGDSGTGAAAFAAATAAIQAGGIDLAAIDRSVAVAYRPYGSMVADNMVYHQIAAIESARLFLAGWSGAELGTLHRVKEGVTDDCLMRIPEGHRAEIGQAVQRLLRPTRPEEKNSPSPSSTPSARGNSTASKTPPRSGPS